MSNINISNIKTIEEVSKVRAELKSLLNKLSEVEDVIINEQYDDLLKSKHSEAIRCFEESKMFSVDRDLQGIFCDGLRSIGFNSYGDRVDSEDNDDYTGVYEDELLLIKAFTYSDSDCSCGFEEECSQSDDLNGYEGFHSADCGCQDDSAINFWYKPTNLKISWYKYALRGSYSNQELSEEYVKAIFAHLDKSKLYADN